VTLWAACVGGQDPAPTAAETGPEAEAAKRFQAYCKQTSATYEMRANSATGTKLSLILEPILRWSNPVGGRQAHGEVFLWTDDGRPGAVLSLYRWTGPDGAVHEHHEFCSLATGPLVTDGPGNRDWSPQEAGVRLIPVPGAPVPATSAVRRLSQMRELAERFTAEKTTREEMQARELRLLTQPVHRYSSERHAVLDGALFSLVEATDPEIFLLLEARPAQGLSQWHYAFARMNSIRLAASYQGQKVWEAPLLPWIQALNRSDQPYTAFSIR